MLMSLLGLYRCLGLILVHGNIGNKRNEQCMKDVQNNNFIRQYRENLFQQKLKATKQSESKLKQNKNLWNKKQSPQHQNSQVLKIGIEIKHSKRAKPIEILILITKIFIEMFVINFDFSDYHSHFKFLLINVPVILTEALTYPLQRIQTQLITRNNYLTNNQFNESRLILRQMLGIEKFPKFLHGIRYSIDYSVTQMTTKFFVFDWLMELNAKTPQQQFQELQKLRLNPTLRLDPPTLTQQLSSKVAVYAKCIIANALGTFLSQSAFNYQVLASSLPVDAKNRSDDVRQKLLQYTKNRKGIPFIGLKYTVPVSIYNTILQVFLIEKLSQFFKINQDSTKNYTLEELSTAISAFLVTGFAFHYSYLRQVELIMKMQLNSIPFLKGLWGTMVRHTARGMSLYALYFLWFEHESKREIEQTFEKREARINQLPSYRH